MQPNSAINASSLAMESEPVAAGQTVAGEPRTGATALTSLGGFEVGVWEMTAGVMRDVEADEIFVVLSGRATVTFDDGSPTLELSGGDVVRLAAGAHTVWTVTETLRKVYIT